MKSILKKLFVLTLLITTILVSSACKPGESSEPTDNLPKLNIIDDKYRNWYEIFVYSFYDTNNDGYGDLNGVTKKLDYIKDMGYNGIWLMPICPSPTYHKYDVKDYYQIDEAYGTLDDFKNLMTEAHKRGIKVIVDLVVNHSSSEHPWFKEAYSYVQKNQKTDGLYCDYYNFTTTPSTLGFTKVNGTNYYYESRFWSGMPDLNLDSENVRNEIVNIMSYWLKDLGADGFRLDAVTSYYTGNVPKNVEFLSWLNTEAKKIKPDCYIVGEAWVGSDYEINRYYQSGIDSFFLFTGSQATGSIASVVKQQSGNSLGKLMVSLQNTYGEDAILAPFLGNHDTMRPGSFMPGVENVKMAAGVMAMLNGGCFVYYGEEIGMISKDGSNSDPHKRIAMYWSNKSVYEGWCYNTPENIKIDDTYYYYPSVEEQLQDEQSILNYYKMAMRLRNAFPSIARGKVTNYSDNYSSYVCVVTKEYAGELITIVINLDSFEQNISLDQSALNVTSIAGELYATNEGKATLNGTNLVIPPYAIVILK